MDEQSRDEILSAINRLVSFYPSRSDEPLRTTVEGFIIALGDIPGRHVSSAVVRFMQGRVHRENSAFRPNGEELAKEARRLWNVELAAAYQARQTQIEAQPESLTPEEIARRKAMVARINERLFTVADKGKPRRFADWNPAEAERQLAERASKPILPVAVSDELAASPLLQPATTA